MLSVKEKFSQLEIADSFQRVDELHILDLYLGVDSMSRYTLFLVSECEPKPMFSSQIIIVQIGQRKDKFWGISFSLVDNKFEDIFCHFCEDIIESSREVKNAKDGSKFVCSRYLKWQQMLAKFNGNILSPSAIKGLTGELFFLKNFLIPLVGQEIAVNSWIGPEKADQDFVCGNTWYEIKSATSGAESVRISSIEQLETTIDGELVIVYLDKTSNSDCTKITLNNIYRETKNTLISENLKDKFEDILMGLGYYPRDEYDEYLFKFTKMDRYQVAIDFPCIRKSLLPNAIVNAKYELSISSISKFLKV